jgi:DNA-binding transcriptional LysR family regulator
MRGLTLKQLAAVKAIARHGAVTAAANAVGITPSAMTTRLKELEANCGFQLFDRTASGFQLNRAGVVVLGMADRIEAAIEEAQGALAGLSGVTAGALVIGITSTAKYFAPRLIAAFARRFPGVDITLSVGNRQEVIDSLRRLAVDIVIMGRPPADVDLVAEPFGEHPMLIVGPPDHPLVGRRGLTKADVAAGPFLMREEGSGTRTVFEEVFGPRAQRQNRFGIEIGSNETIKQGVMAGLGIALISAHTVAFEVQTERLCVIDVAGLPIYRKWFIAYHASKTVMPAMRAFWDFTLAEGASHLPETPLANHPS